MSNLEKKYFNRGKIGAIILAGFFTASLSFLFLVFSQKNFKASTDYLVVQSNLQTSDFYTVFRSAEYLSNVFEELVYSELFIDRVSQSEKITNREFLPFDRRDRLKEWKKSVKIDKNIQSGMFTISVFRDDSREALQISQAIDGVISQSFDILSKDSGFSSIVVTGPILEKNPTMVDVVTVIIAGFFVGAILYIIRLYYLMEGGKPKENGDEEYLESLREL